MLFNAPKYTKLEKNLFPPTNIIEGVDNIKDLIPLKVASKKLGISYKTLYSWVCNKKIAYTKIGNRYYLTQEQLKALVFVFTKDYTQTTK